MKNARETAKVSVYNRRVLESLDRYFTAAGTVLAYGDARRVQTLYSMGHGRAAARLQRVQDEDPSVADEWRIFSLWETDCAAVARAQRTRIQAHRPQGSWAALLSSAPFRWSSWAPE